MLVVQQDLFQRRPPARRHFARGCRSPGTLSPALLALLLAAIPLPAHAVDFPLRWRWSNPAPHGNNVVGMAYSPTRNLAIQVAERGQIYSSADLRLWIPRESGTTESLRGAAFLNDRIIITGANGLVLYADSPQQFHPGTLLDGATSDWLEAVTASSTLAVAVGDNGAVYTSSDGQKWKRQNSSTTDWLRGVAFGNGTFVATGDYGRVITSPDGANWTPRASGVSSHLHRVWFGHNRFTAVGDAGVVLTSANGGAGWTGESTGATGDLYHASDNNNARLAVGVGEVRLQEGDLWSDEFSKPQPPPPWTYNTSLGFPSSFLIAGQTGMMAEGQKTNLGTYAWQPVSESVRNWLFDVTYAGLFVAVGDRATVMTSGNGVGWSLELVPFSVTNTTFLGVGGDTNLLVAAGDQGSLIISPNTLTNIVVTNIVGTNIIITNQTVSTLGVVWHALANRITTNTLQGIAAFNGLYVVTGDNGTILTSPDGTNWTKRLSRTSKLLSGVAAWPQGLVATGDDGVILTSPDGLVWTEVSTLTTNWLYRVRYLGGLFLAVGQNGTILTSADATNWSSPKSGTSAWLNDAAYAGQTYFVVGNQGAFLSSSNALDWVNRGTITKKSLYGIATDTVRLVCVGLEGIILRTNVDPPVSPVDILAYSRILTPDQSYYRNIFLFAGQPDQRFTLDYRNSLETNSWLAGPNLELLDNSGTLYYLEQIPVTNAAAREFYRTTLIEP